jgi:uncharacterized lipoprotein
MGLAGCASDLYCEEPEAYQAAVSGKRIVAPEGLDDLSEYKEIKIPDVAVKSRAGEKGCVDRPPRYFSE